MLEQPSKQSLDQEAWFRLTKAQTQHQGDLLQQLSERHMLPVAWVVRDVFGIAGMDRALKLPHLPSPNERTVAPAVAMAEAAEHQQATFIEHGLSPDFVAQLRLAAAELATAMGSRDVNQRRRVEATERASAGEAREAPASAAERDHTGEAGGRSVTSGCMGQRARGEADSRGESVGPTPPPNVQADAA